MSKPSAASLFKSAVKILSELTFLPILFGVTLYYLLALFSFHPRDPSIFSVAEPMLKTHNYAGSLGASVAGFLFFYLGFISYLLIVPVVLPILCTRKKSFKKKIVFFCLLSLSIVGITWFLVWLQPNISFRNILIPSGGHLGHVFFQLSISSFGKVGAFVLFLTSMSFVAVNLISPNVAKSIYAKNKIRLTLFYKQCVASMKVKKAALLSVFKKQTVASTTVTKSTIPIEPYIEEFIHSAPAAEPTTIVDKAVCSNEDIENGKEEDMVSKYSQPSINVFQKGDSFELTSVQVAELEATKELLLKTLKEFSVTGNIIAIQPGPVVTVFEFQPDAGTKQSKLLALVDDIALALRTSSIIIHPVPGKRALGIQVPNRSRKMVRLGDLFNSPAFLNHPSALTFAAGKSISGAPSCIDLTEMPHLLIAGATGSGKSVAINALICSIIMKSSPEKVRMILVDPKMLELSVYEGIPHLMMPVITDPQRASSTLRWAVQEMERRYRLMQFTSVRNVSNLNELWERSSKEKRHDLLESYYHEYGEQLDSLELPYLLIVIDELADLMLTAPKEIESLIQRLAQKARASGIHLVLATQRPSVDIITGVIKANLPSRISFQVVSKHDSRTILDQIGAEKLLGKGDMLFQKPGVNKTERIQGAFVSDGEVTNLVEQVKAQNPITSYDEKLMGWVEKDANSKSNEHFLGTDDEDDLKMEEAIEIASNNGTISASFLQRQLKIGYNRAARIVESMEKKGFISGADGAKPRKWLGTE